MIALKETTAKTSAQRKSEKTGIITLVIVILITSSPTYLWMIPQTSLTFNLLSLAAILIWVIIFGFIGPRRILIAAITLRGRYASISQQSREDVEKFALGLALQAGLSSPAGLSLKVKFDKNPSLSATLMCGDTNITPLNNAQCFAVLDLLTGDGDIYRLAGEILPYTNLEWDQGLSAHERVSVIQFSQDAIESAILLRSSFPQQSS